MKRDGEGAREMKRELEKVRERCSDTASCLFIISETLLSNSAYPAPCRRLGYFILLIRLKRGWEGGGLRGQDRTIEHSLTCFLEREEREERKE